MAVPTLLTITRTWTATDACGNFVSMDQTITIEDTTDPVLSIPPDVTIECDDDSSPATNGTATATDNCDAGPIVTFSDATSAGACANASTITRTWTATDVCGNSVSADQIISIEDTTNPIITACPTDQTISCLADIPAPDISLVSGTDNCGNVTIDYVGDVSDGLSCPETFTRTYRVTDECGNTTDCIQLIMVNDIEVPVVTQCNDITVECLFDVPLADITQVLATDNCGEYNCNTHFRCERWEYLPRDYHTDLPS